MKLSRVLRHLVLPHWSVLRAFPKPALGAIKRAIASSEASHQGELRFVVEAGLPLSALWRGQSPRARAVELFSRLRVWDTAQNSGVLIYLQLIDRRVEIVADRGIDARVGPEFWNVVCRRMEQAFREGRFEAGSLVALSEITAALREHFPSAGDNPNELPDSPLILG
jgi:uncharacterized membrane protein